MVEPPAARCAARSPFRRVASGSFRRVVTGAAAVVAVLCGATGGWAAGTAGSTAAESLPAYHPGRLTHLGDARQVVVVSSGSWAGSRAVLRTWARAGDGRWVLRGGPVRARVGRHGFVPADRRRQSSGTSPAGTFAVVSAFGNGPDPGTALPYRALDRTDWWTYDPRDPATYNVFQPRRVSASRWRTSWAEDLSAYGGQYRYVAVLDFNLPQGVHRSADGQRVAGRPADTRRGGGIFLHASGPGATSGCVSVPRTVMRRVLRWLDPAADPVLVMGPRSALSRL